MVAKQARNVVTSDCRCPSVRTTSFMPIIVALGAHVDGWLFRGAAGNFAVTALLLLWLYNNGMTRTGSKGPGRTQEAPWSPPPWSASASSPRRAAAGRTRPAWPAWAGRSRRTPWPAARSRRCPRASRSSSTIGRCWSSPNVCRANGITDFPDPNSGGGIQIGSSSGIDPQGPQFQAAQKACQKYLPVPDLSKAQIAQHEAQALELAKCMRANGVPNFPDPQFAANGAEMVKPVPGLDPGSPTYQAAANKCNG